MTMKLTSSIILRPVSSFFIMALVVALILTSVIFIWHVTKQVEHATNFSVHYVHTQSLQDIETAARFLLPVGPSALKLAKVLNSSLNGTQHSLSTVKNSVAYNMFLVLSTLQLSQISYIGSNGSLFSYYTEGNQIVSVYSDNFYFKTAPNASSPVKTYHSQSVDSNTGMRYGDVGVFESTFSIDSIWFQKALNRTNGFASLETGLEKARAHVFLYTIPINGKGVLSLGFPVKSFTNVISRIQLHQGDLYLATKDGIVLTQTGPLMISVSNDIVAIHDQVRYSVNISCEPNEELLRNSKARFGRANYKIYCAPLEIAGVKSVSVLVTPHKGLVNVDHSKNTVRLVLLSLMLVGLVVISISYFIYLIVEAARREMFLRANLIKQMEATQQAEKKSMNKSLAFASASHDVRSFLAGLDGLVQLCREIVSPNSQIDSYLKQMKDVASDLVGILNSVLDTSKIEAGKMQLAEEEFDLTKVLEDMVNMYYLIGRSKGIEVMLDPCDSSIVKYSLVKGDCGKLKQILTNLLHNAIKFTSEGHISIRAWAKKHKYNSENLILSSGNDGGCKCLSWFVYKNSETYNDLSALHAVQQRQNCVEFIVEVDDTGKGIPKDNKKSVFENFVQVKETALHHGGTGLGLGIVQSLVRLMGGEINVMDKELGEKGACFRFNIFLSACNDVTSTPNSKAEGEDVKLMGDPVPDDLNQHNQSPFRRPQGSHAVLFIQGDERRRIIQKFMNSKSIKVPSISSLEQLSLSLENIKHGLDLTYHSSSGKSELSLKGDSMSSKDFDHILPLQKRTSQKRTSQFTLIVIDVDEFSDDQLSEVCLSLANFRRELDESQCRIILLYTPNPESESRRREKKMLIHCDHLLIKPFHGSCLYQVLRVLPEFGGATTIRCSVPKPNEKIAGQSSSSGICDKPSKKSKPGDSEMSRNKPLNGRKVLVVEDTQILRILATKLLKDRGAIVDSCENGEAAVKQVSKALEECSQSEQGICKTLPYDMVFMDCQMPIMDGFEATRKIREEEKRYGVHIPIIALTADEKSDEATKLTVEAGMDFFITKPLNNDMILEAIRLIDSNQMGR